MIFFLNWCFLMLLQQNAAQNPDIPKHPAWKMLPTTKCGQKKSEKSIPGAEEVSLGQYPWMTRLGYKKRANDSVKYICGAAMITRKYLVTAAHCFQGPGYYSVRFGEHNFGKTKSCQGNKCAPPPQNILVVRAALHKGYAQEYYLNESATKYYRYYNDIAVLQLQFKVTLNEFVQPICLPQGAVMDPRFDHTGDVIYSGWGLVPSKLQYDPNVLMHVSFKFMENRICMKHFSELQEEKYAKFCVAIRRGKFSCDGDTGGPVMKRDDIGRTYLLGVLSYGLEKCGLGPALLTNVAYHLKWILDDMSKKFNCKKLFVKLL